MYKLDDPLVNALDVRSCENGNASSAESPFNTLGIVLKCGGSPIVLNELFSNRV